MVGPAAVDEVNGRRLGDLRPVSFCALSSVLTDFNAVPLVSKTGGHHPGGDVPPVRPAAFFVAIDGCAAAV
jgi:hypothetical protein